MSNEGTFTNTTSIVRSQTLPVPGARLYYEVRGSGPVLVLVPGGPADGSIFGEVAGHLSRDYTVVTYDPRGLSHSKLLGPVDDEHLVESLADDIHRLLAVVAHDKAFVFANSGGAIIALELAVRHPDQMATLVAHEPPRFGPSRGGGADLHELYRARGVRAAMTTFMADAGLGEPPSDLLDSMESNSDFEFFLGHYIVGLGGHETDLASLKRVPCRIVPAVGRDSRGELAHLGGLGLAEILETEAEVFPGGHGGFMSHPAEFARKLQEIFHRP
jgi:pimeloyl-ACP methyl ester carboxylesterase